MYPSIGDFGRPSTSSSQQNSTQVSYSQPGASRWPPQQLAPSVQNGPSSSAGTFPMLRVHIADQYRTFPPVMINSGLEDIPRTPFTYDFNYEQLIIRRLQSEHQAATPTTTLNIDPLEPALIRFSELGYLREEVALANAVMSGNPHSDDEKIVDFCKNYRELKSMGFKCASVVGALVLHKSDLAAATEACLAAQA